MINEITPTENLQQPNNQDVVEKSTALIIEQGGDVDSTLNWLENFSINLPESTENNNVENTINGVVNNVVKNSNGKFNPQKVSDALEIIKIYNERQSIRPARRPIDAQRDLAWVIKDKGQLHKLSLEEVNGINKLLSNKQPLFSNADIDKIIETINLKFADKVSEGFANNLKSKLS